MKLPYPGGPIIATNWRYRKFEIDIIAQHNDQMVFVEVKTRKNDTFGEPEEFVSRRQQNFLIAAAHHYLVEHHIELESRFDVIAITENNNKPTVKHLESAFYPKPK